MTEINEYGAEISEGEKRLIERSVEVALQHEHASGDVSVLVTTEEEIQRLNESFRKIDRVTDVLTFPFDEGDELISTEHCFLGDIAICKRRAEEQAEEFGHSLERELGFLTIHGVLHLLGYDHMQPEDEQIMRRHQTDILKEMGLTR